MSDKAIRTVSWIVGAGVFNIAFDILGIQASRIVPCIIGVILGQVVGEIIVKMRAKSAPPEKTVNDHGDPSS